MTEVEIRQLIRNELKIAPATMDVSEAATYTGICVDTLYTMAREKQIPHIRLRGRVFFRKESIDNWFSQLEKESVQMQLA
ncbi:helix-turn-helix domain-containing protein [Paenibacillus gansuensis]|uniref:Helix-turn-helix domain-containing protein n=1 Tax=Paenibacillus gansuensis TaxID=306542 RepID=A0ABW5PGT9_9BACL